MTEVGGNAAIYIDPADPADPAGAADVIASALTERERWRMAGLENAARFSTQAMMDAYVHWYGHTQQAMRPVTSTPLRGRS